MIKSHFFAYFLFQQHMKQPHDAILLMEGVLFWKTSWQVYRVQKVNNNLVASCQQAFETLTTSHNSQQTGIIDWNKPETGNSILHLSPPGTSEVGNSRWRTWVNKRMKTVYRQNPYQTGLLAQTFGMLNKTFWCPKSWEKKRKYCAKNM